MQRYFVNGNEKNISFLEGDIFHITHVMRLKVHDQIEVVLNGKVYLSSIISLSPLKVEIIKELNENRELSNEITLLYCLPKGDKLDLVVQKATELGVKKIVGVISSRTIIKVDDDKKEKKIARLNKIIKEACEQSKRTYQPEFIDIINYKDIEKFKSKHNFIAYENEAMNGFNLYDELSAILAFESVSIIVGPEGGFDIEEVDFANALGYKNVSLGKLILRSETAAIYMMSVLSFVLSRF